MSSATAFRCLILIIPVVWVVIRLLPSEHPRYGDPMGVAQQAQELQSRQVGQGRIAGMTERDKETFDRFVSHESRFKDYYQSHYRTSGHDYNHHRLAYKYGFDLAVDPPNQKMEWKSIEPQARRNWDDGIMELWSTTKPFFSDGNRVSNSTADESLRAAWS